MSMHLEGPWLSTTGKSKSKKKFRNSAEAQKARELESGWKDLKKKWGVEEENKKRKRALEAPVWVETTKTYRRETQKIPSLNGGRDMSPAIKPPQKVYTGSQIKGIATMHKSNAVPVFSNEEAVDIAKMRR